MTWYRQPPGTYAGALSSERCPSEALRVAIEPGFPGDNVEFECTLASATLTGPLILEFGGLAKPMFLEIVKPDNVLFDLFIDKRLQGLRKDRMISEEVDNMTRRVFNLSQAAPGQTCRIRPKNFPFVVSKLRIGLIAIIE
jgi:hypothetical protein